MIARHAGTRTSRLLGHGGGVANSVINHFTDEDVSLVLPLGGRV